MKINRRINWISSTQPSVELSKLELLLADFYSNNKHYFATINFTEDNWINEGEKGYLQIVELAKQSESICEVGCGGSNLLIHYPELQVKYTGLDFSREQLEKNAKKFSSAKFETFIQPNQFPVQSQQFDFVFCVFVIEHVTRPQAFLNECKRVLKQNGTLMILCPDFLGKGRMTSQRAGFSEGTTREKIRLQKFFDALVTLFDNRIRIPIYCFFYRVKALIAPQFYINLSPTVFIDSFMPDVDAVYLTYKKEIKAFLKEDFKEIGNSSPIKSYEKEKKIIFLQMQKLA